MLSCLALMVQVAIFDGAFFDAFSPFYDGRGAPEVNVCRGNVTETFMVALMIIMLNEGADLVFQMPRQIIVLQQDAVLERLVPTLYLALWVWG